MAWDSGNILFSSNFEMRVGKPLDAKQVVTDNLDLNSITFPYDGLIVHVTSTDETYVCVAKDDVPSGVDGGGAIDADVWKTVGGGAADVVVLPDQSPAPSGIADKSQLVSLDDTTAESRPDFLYRFDEGVDVTTATDDGRLQSDGTKYNSGGSAYNVTGSAPWGNRARFNHLAVSKISVGTAGAAAPFYFTSDTGDRGDFEIQFRFVLDDDDEVYCLMSTDATDAATEGFYAVLVDTDTGVNDSSIIFRSMHSIDSVVAQFEAEWTIPGDVNWLTAHHLAISFMEDDRSITGNTNGTGKLRCYFDGVVLEDDKTEGAYSIAAPEFNNIGRKPSTSTIWPVNLGQYLDGSGGSSVYYLNGDMDEFAVYNHRCLHNTSDKFTPPAAPTRAAALSVPNVVDSEGTASPILTTSNVGMLLPKSVEGLADGSLWNDRGAVKIAPLTGDLDEAASAVIVDGILELMPVSTPSATTGVAKIYAKSNTDPAPELLLHFDNNVTDSGPNGHTVNGYNLEAYQTSSAGGGASPSGFSKCAKFDGSSSYILYDDPGIGTSDFTYEFWARFNNVTTTSHFDVITTASGEAGSTINGHLEIFKTWSGSNTAWAFQMTDGSSWFYITTGTNQALVADTWYHVAMVREGDVLSIFSGEAGDANGTLIAQQTVTGAGSVDLGDGTRWVIGRYLNGSGFTANYYLGGQLDEFRITKSAVYSGTGVGTFSYPLPVAPFGLPSTARLYVMDGEGNEVQLTP